MLSAVGSILCGVIIAFCEGPLYAIICLAYFPLILMMLLCLSKAAKDVAFEKVLMVKKLGGITEESLTSIKLVASFA